MKKNILLIFVLGTMFACSGGKTKTGDADVTPEQIEALEQSNRKIEMVIDSSTAKIDTLQTQIDGLLNEI